jgi:predicted transposase YbfD/YdcC
VTHLQQNPRKVEVFAIPELSKSLDKKWKGWESVVCFVRVERNRKPFNTKKKGDEKSKTKVSYYIYTKFFDAKTFAEIIQSYWGIENKVNHVKDVQFKEDLSRIRVKPGIFSRLRGMGLNLYRLNDVQNISQERYLNCLNVNFALNYKGIT